MHGPKIWNTRVRTAGKASRSLLSALRIGLRLSKAEQGVVHAVTHAGVMRVLTAQLLGVPRANAIQWPLDFGAIVWLKRVRRGFVLVRWNA